MAKRTKYTSPSLEQADLFEDSSHNSTGWAPPTEYPRLSGRIALDLETRDPELLKRGPGWPMRAGYPVGVSVATDDGACWYFPVAHAAGGNLDASMTWRWLRDQLPQVSTVVMQNAVYDMGWLRTVGITELPPVVDTKAMAALIDENRTSYSLNALGETYVGAQKKEETLTAYAKQWGLHPKNDLWRMPPFVVGPYAEQDARLTLQLHAALHPLIVADHLEAVLQLEHDLLPILVRMRERGVRVDVERAGQLREQLLEQEATLRTELKARTGRAVEPWEPDSVATALVAQGIPVPRLESGNYSITKEFLAQYAAHDPVAAAVLQLRRVNKLRTTFVESAFLAYATPQGRVHPEFHPLRSDEGGAVTGRFSSSNFNFQQLPARREEEARLIRGLVIPESGATWYAADYNQQEPRMLVHFAALMKLRRADEAAQAYAKNPKTDFHQFVSELTALPRKDAKIINLGKFYGMGGAKYARSVGLPTKMIERNGRLLEVAGDEAQAQLNQYAERLPFVPALFDECSRVAERRGYIRTILGRRRRFRPVVERGASSHKAMNALIQGSSADQNKLAMVALDRAGYTPSVVVHDEIDGSCDPAHAARIKEIMETVLPLRVPSVVDVALGINWGEAT